jgi:16S rRNA (cytidine1402-2'-O)-methyltransferase
MTSAKGHLYLVPTPIGNLDDITERALQILEHVDIVACEDTRVSGRLLSHYGIKKQLVSYHEFNERERASLLLGKIKNGETVAVVTDAGSPGISDPAYRIVRLAIDHDIKIEALPGPCALIPALSASGLPTDRFFFEGFLPHKGGPRQKRLEEIKEYQHTLIFYESPHRVEKSLKAMLETFGNRQACLAREISKKFEEYLRGTIQEILDTISQRKVKGEIVLVIAGAQKK